MPPLEECDLFQKALLWPRTGTAGDGEPVVAATPTVIDCRWVRRQGEALDAEGNKIGVDASLVVYDPLVVNSIVWEWSDWTPGAPTPTPTSGFMQVITYNETPSIHYRETRRTAGLKRFRNALPTQA